MLVGVEVYRRIVVADSWDWTAIGSIAQFVLILLVASIPVALPAVMSVTMAIGAYALSRQKAILSRLSAIEELAGVDVLCSDKTGTLTLNQLTVDSVIPFGAAKSDDVTMGAALATQASSEDPIDLAVLHALKDRSALEKFKQTKFVPFDPVNKRTVATVVDAAGSHRAIRQRRAAGDRRACQARSGHAGALPGDRQRTRQPRLSGARRRQVGRWQAGQRAGSFSASSRSATRRGRTPRRRSQKPNGLASTSRW